MAGPANVARLEPGVTDVSAPCGIVRGRVEDGIAGGGVGAGHLADLPFFFGNLHQPGVAREVSSSVAQFVTCGDLTVSAPGEWPAFTPEKRVTMVIGRRSAAVADHVADRLDFWEARLAGTAAPLASVGTSADRGRE
jgi:carboxylesterase type B